MSLSAEKFNQGMSTSEYIEQIKVNKQPFQDIYQSVDVPSGTSDFFNGLAETVNLAVFTAAWCGDALSTTPAILRLADSCPKISVKVFDRDEDLELTDSYLPENRAGTVPVFVVLDSAMKEISRFVETAIELVPSLDAMDEAIAQEVAGQSEEDARAAGRGKRTAFRVSHAKEWGNVILDSFQNTVSDGLKLAPSERPAVGGTKWPPEG